MDSSRPPPPLPFDQIWNYRCDAAMRFEELLEVLFAGATAVFEERVFGTPRQELLQLLLAATMVGLRPADNLSTSNGMASLGSN